MNTDKTQKLSTNKSTSIDGKNNESKKFNVSKNVDGAISTRQQK